MNEDRIKQQVIDSLDTIGINVYFIHFDLGEEPAPYYAYVFDESLIEEAQEAFYDGYMIEGAYDDFAFDCDFEDSLCRDIISAISYNYIKEYHRSTTDRG